MPPPSPSEPPSPNQPTLPPRLAGPDFLSPLPVDSLPHYSTSPLPSLSTPSIHPRLSLPTSLRVPLVIAIASTFGFILGSSHGGRTAALRFRAENAHRLPKSTKGWYLYHKSKNYAVLWESLKEGGRMGGKLGFWVGGFFWLEAAIDQSRRGRRDFVSSAVAGMVVAGGWSGWNRFPPVTTARMARMGLATGLAFGLMQDAVSWAKGRNLDYVEWLVRRFKKEEA